jgi:hypothetical protein
MLNILNLELLLATTLLSIIYEIRYDTEGEYVWLITYWP